MAVHISQHATVDPRAELADGVEVGPYCVVGPQAQIGAGTRLLNQVTIMGHVTLGAQNVLYPGVVIGGEPQDLSYRGSNTQVQLGDHNVIREGVTINRATEKEDGTTRLGSHNLLMACCHVAHDCKLGSHIVIANGTLLGGHVHIHDHASLSGGVGVHHFATIGSFSFVAGMSRLAQDVPPYLLVDGWPSRPRCVNLVGLKRHGFSAHAIRCLMETHRLLYRMNVGPEKASLTLREREMLVPEAVELISFVQTQHEGHNGRGRERRRAA